MVKDITSGKIRVNRLQKDGQITDRRPKYVMPAVGSERHYIIVAKYLHNNNWQRKEYGLDIGQ